MKKCLLLLVAALTFTAFGTKLGKVRKRPNGDSVKHQVESAFADCNLEPDLQNSKYGLICTTKLMQFGDAERARYNILGLYIDILSDFDANGNPTRAGIGAYIWRSNGTFTAGISAPDSDNPTKLMWKVSDTEYKVPDNNAYLPSMTCVEKVNVEK